MKKLKTEVTRAEEEASRQKQELQETLESSFKIKFDNLQRENEDSLEKLRYDLDETLGKLESCRKVHTEDILLVENAKQQALSLAHQEHKSLSQRLTETLNNMEEVNQEFEKHRREANGKIEKDRSSIAELQIEVSKLRNLLNDKDLQLGDEKKSLQERLNREKQARIQAESEIDVLKSNLKVVNDKEAKVQDELLDVKTKLHEISETKSVAVTNLREIERKWDESKLQIERLEHIKDNLSETIKQYEEEKDALEIENDQGKIKLRNLENALFEANHDLDAHKAKIGSLQGNNHDFEDQISYWQSRHDELHNEYQDLTIQLEKIKANTQAEEELKNMESTELHSLRLRIAELESIKAVLEKELNSLKITATSDQETLAQKINTLNKTIDEIRTRERKLEDQRHNLEICLSHAQQESKDLQVRLTGQEGRMSELFTTMARVEGSKKDLEAKISNVASLIHHVRSSSAHARSRPSTPTRTPRASSTHAARRASSPWPPIVSDSGEIDFEQIKSDVRELVGRISLAVKERDEALHQVAFLKKKNDEILVSSMDLEDQNSNQKKKSRGFEDQLRKLELKVAHSDANLAETVRMFRLESCKCYIMPVLSYYKRCVQSVVFNSGQKMALRAFYLINFHRICGHITT